MDRKQVGAWALFDFANSVFPAVIVTVAFNYFFINVVIPGNAGGQGDWWWGRAPGLSAAIVALSLPRSRTAPVCASDGRSCITAAFFAIFAVPAFFYLPEDGTGDMSVGEATKRG